MPPKRGTKKAAGLAQPTLSFQSRKPSVPSPNKKRTTANRAVSQQSISKSHVSETEYEDDDDSTPVGRNNTSKSKSNNRRRAESGTPTPALNVIEDNDDDLVKEAENQPHTKRGTLNGGDQAALRQLDVKSKEVKKLMGEARKAMGNLEPIHAGPDTHNDVHHILRVFDMTSAYGPCVGMTRLQRWERAQKWGLNPPEEIRNILVTVQGRDDGSYRETVLHGWV